MGDLQQFVGSIVRELDFIRETAGKAAVGGEEGLHLLGVSGKDDHQLVPVILHPLHEGVDGFEAEAVLLAAVEAVGFVNEEDAAEGALDDAVGQRGGVAGVAAHEVAAAHLHELPALERPDGLEVLGHQAGDGGLAGTGVAGEDHVHRKAGRLHPGGGAALLDLEIIGQTEDVFLDRGKAHQLRDLGLDLVQRAGVGGGQQVEQGGGGGIVQAEEKPLRRGSQGDGAGQLFVGLEAVFTQSPEDAVTAAGKPGGPLLGCALGGDVIPHIDSGGEGQAQPGGDLLGQRVQLLGREGGKILPRVGGRLADIAQRRDHARAELVRQRGAALVGEEDEILAAGVKAAHRAGSQRGPGVHKNALPVDEIAAGQGGAALDRKVGKGLQKAGIAAFVVLKDQNLAGGVEGGVQVLQKQLLRAGVRVERKVEGGDAVVFQQPAGGHAAGRFLKGEVPPGAGAAPQQDDVPGRRCLGAQHEGAAHGPDDTLHKGVLPQHGLLDLVGQPLEAAQMFGLCVHSALGQQPVVLHIPQHLAAVGEGGFGGGVLRLDLGGLGFQHRVQLFLLLQQGRVQIVQAAGLLRLRVGCGGRRLELAARPEDAVHQRFPIVSVCHVVPSVHRFVPV